MNEDVSLAMTSSFGQNSIENDGQIASTIGSTLIKHRCEVDRCLINIDPKVFDFWDRVPPNNYGYDSRRFVPCCNSVTVGFPISFQVTSLRTKQNQSMYIFYGNYSISVSNLVLCYAILFVEICQLLSIPQSKHHPEDNTAHIFQPITCGRRRQYWSNKIYHTGKSMYLMNRAVYGSLADS